MSTDPRNKHLRSPEARAPSRPISILAFLPDLTRGGAQRSVINLLNTLDPNVATARLAVPNVRGGGKAWLGGQVELTDFGRNRVRATIGSLRRLTRACRPEVLFASMIDANIVAALATIGLSEAPRLVLRETNSHRAREDIGPFRRALIGWAYRRADRVIALSQGVRDELIADYRLNPGRVDMIHNPVDVAGISRRARLARRMPPPWGEWSRERPVVLGAGRLVKQKGFDLLLAAFAAMSEETCLVLIGEGPDRTKLAQLARELKINNRVLMPGFVEDPVDWMAHADLFALSSRWEGFGHVIVEAMAAGCPVIATDCPHGPRDIITDGVDGVLVPPLRPRCLERGASKLLADPELRFRIAAAGAHNARRFDCPTITAKYQQAFLASITPYQDV